MAGFWIGWMLACGGKTEPTPCEPPGTQVETPRAAGCLTVRDGHLLMVQMKDGRWSIPGGAVENGEDSATAAARETLEEASVTVVVGAVACAAERTGFVAHSCTMTGVPDAHGDGRETLDAEFLSADEIAALPDTALRFPVQRAAYLRALGQK
ncbi:MAG: NUDIX hydrolase [Myxococcota bacterium]